RTRPTRARRARRARRPLSARGSTRPPWISLGRGLREQLPEPREPCEHPALDRTERLPEPLRELGLREAAVVGELDRLALPVGELCQRGLDALALEPQECGVVGRPGRRL